MSLYNDTGLNNMKTIIEGILFIFIMMIGFIIGALQGIENERKDAIKAGVGRYTIDPITGVKTFKYGVEK